MYNSIFPDPQWFPKDPEICKTDYYKSVYKCFTKLWQLGILYRSAGQCLALSDLMQKFLKGEGIESELFECNLMVQNKQTDNYTFIGYEYDHTVDYNCNPTDSISNGILKDHVVVITKTEIPILIDLTCSFIDQNYPFIIQPILNTVEGKITIDLPTSEWVYSRKNHSHLPVLYQDSILNRIKKDIEIDKNLNLMLSKINLINKIIIVLTITVTLNFIRGTHDYYQKYVIKDNGWGPNPNYVNQSTKP